MTRSVHIYSLRRSFVVAAQMTRSFPSDVCVPRAATARISVGLNTQIDLRQLTRAFCFHVGILPSIR